VKINSIAGCVFALFTIIGCSGEKNPSTVTEPSPQQAVLLVKAKQAILDLDIDALATIASTINVNHPLPDKSTLLAWAVETQTPELVELLLSKGADTNANTGNPFTPMIQACRYGNPSIISTLLDHNANPMDVIEDGTTAFQLCAGSTTPELLSRMVSLGAQVSAQNQYGQTALMWAANSGKPENVRFLVNQGANINHKTLEGYNPLFFAIKSYNLDTVQVVIESGADLLATAEDGTTAAQLGVYTKNYPFLLWFSSELTNLLPTDAVNDLLTQTDRDGNQLLHAAVTANQLALVEALLKAGASPTAVSEPSTLTWRYEANFKMEEYIPPQLTPIEIAEQNGLLDILKVLTTDKPT